jgi:uncharacterized integral membrane protein
VKIAGWILFGLFALLAIVFAANNFGPVALDLWPLPYTVELPVFLLIVGMIFLGFLGGLLASWLAGARRRRKGREQRRELKSLQSEKESRAQDRRAALEDRSGDRAA